jgi:hypothetical protein
MEILHAESQLFSVVQFFFAHCQRCCGSLILLWIADPDLSFQFGRDPDPVYVHMLSFILLVPYVTGVGARVFFMRNSLGRIRRV